LITVAGNFNIQVRNEQKPKKVEIYDKVINLFFDSIFAQKLGQEPKTEEELVKSIHDMTPDSIFTLSFAKWQTGKILQPLLFCCLVKCY